MKHDALERLVFRVVKDVVEGPSRHVSGEHGGNPGLNLKNALRHSGLGQEKKVVRIEGETYLLCRSQTDPEESVRRALLTPVDDGVIRRQQPRLAAVNQMLAAVRNRGILTGADQGSREGVVVAKRRSFSATKGPSFWAR